MKFNARALSAGVFVLLCSSAFGSRPSLQDFLNHSFSIELVAARDADRIAWIENRMGRRNVFTAAAPDFERVRLTDFMEDDGTDLADLRLSADGSLLVFVRGHDPNRQGWVANPSSDPRGGRQSIWAVRTSGGPPWQVADGSDPVLSPDGRTVLVTRQGEILKAGVDAMQGGRTVSPLLRAWGRNLSPLWSPDGRKVAFVSQRGDHSFIGVFDLSRQQVRYLAPGVDRDSSPAWSPDSRRVAFIRRPGAVYRVRRSGRDGEAEQQQKGLVTQARFAGGYDRAIWVADVESGRGRQVWHDGADDESFDGLRGLEWAGQRLIFRAEPDNWQHLFSVPVDGGDPAADPLELTPGEGIVEFWALSRDGQTLFYSTNIGDIDRRHLWRVPVAGGDARQLTRGEGSETYPVPLPSGAQLVLLATGPSLPQSAAVMRADGGELRSLVPLPEAFPRSAHVAPQQIVLEAPDGVKFHNQLFLPPDLEPGERRPALLFTHGGPRRQMLLGYHYRSFYHLAYAVNQYFASRGYVVLSVNYRSGIGYGRNFRVIDDSGRRGASEYQDVLAAGRWLAARDDVDEAAIGLWGLSYGGILTATGLARNSDVFAAGVDIAGVHLWGGDEYDPDSVAYRSSAVADIDKWTSPVLLVHGDDDRNVAFSQTTHLVQLLRDRQVPHELIVFPDEVHSFLVFDRWLQTFRAAEDFFKRHLIGETAAGSN